MIGAVPLFLGAVTATFFLHTRAYFLLPISIAIMLFGLMLMTRSDLW